MKIDTLRTGGGGEERKGCWDKKFGKKSECLLKLHACIY